MLKNLKNKIPKALTISILAHACLIYSVKTEIQELKNLESLSQKSDEPILVDLEKVTLISKSEVQKIKSRQLQRQIVASENKGIEEKPSESRFYGEKNNTALRQTIAKNTGSFKKAGYGALDGLDNAKGQENLVKTIPQKKKIISFSDLGGFGLKDAQKIIEREQKAIEEIKKSEFEEFKAKGLTVGDKGIIGLAQNNDHVEDVSLGDITNLNTQEYKYYGFYQRIRAQLEQHWGSTIKEKANSIYRSGRRMPASSDLITSVSVILNEKGHIVEMTINGSSGVRELDQAAIESFNKAGPFPNPPKGLLVDGRAVIQWGFVVKS